MKSSCLLWSVWSMMSHGSSWISKISDFLSHFPCRGGYQRTRRSMRLERGGASISISPRTSDLSHHVSVLVVLPFSQSIFFLELPTSPHWDPLLRGQKKNSDVSMALLPRSLLMVMLAVQHSHGNWTLLKGKSRIHIERCSRRILLCKESSFCHFFFHFFQAG